MYYCMIIRYDQFKHLHWHAYTPVMTAALQSLYTSHDPESSVHNNPRSKALTITSSDFIPTKYWGYNLLNEYNLEHLTIKGVENINPSSLRMIRLKHLDLSECGKIQFTMLSHFPHLETVTVKDEDAANAVRKGIFRREGFQVIIQPH